MFQRRVVRLLIFGVKELLIVNDIQRKFGQIFSNELILTKIIFAWSQLLHWQWICPVATCHNWHRKFLLSILLKLQSSRGRNRLGNKLNRHLFTQMKFTREKKNWLRYDESDSLWTYLLIVKYTEQVIVDKQTKHILWSFLVEWSIFFWAKLFQLIENQGINAILNIVLKLLNGLRWRERMNNCTVILVKNSSNLFWFKFTNRISKGFISFSNNQELDERKILTQATFDRSRN